MSRAVIAGLNGNEANPREIMLVTVWCWMKFSVYVSYKRTSHRLQSIQ